MTRTFSPTAKGGGAALAVLLAGTFMASLDTAIVNVAGPAIQADVGVSGAALQLVISGYALAYAALLITGARLGDDHGHRRLFLAGLAGFTLTSLLAGLAWSTAVLIAARIGQGVAAAAMGPQVMTVIQLQYDGAARMRPWRCWPPSSRPASSSARSSAARSSTSTCSAPRGGPCSSSTCRSALALLAIGPRLLPRPARRSGARMDWLGVALMTDAITLVMVPLMFGHEVGWAWWTWASPGGRRADRARARARTCGGCGPAARSSGSACSPRPFPASAWLDDRAMMVAYGGFLFTLTLHLQQGLGDTPAARRPDVRALRARLRA